MNYDQLKRIANKMVAEGKGILAADESTPTCTKRFDSIGVESTKISRNKYRDLLFTTSGLEDYISGIILYDETIKQSTISESIPFPKYFESKNIIPGIKVDMGTKPLALHSKEKVTEGLDGLQQRLEGYYNLGARFAKWRAVITIGNGIPTKACIQTNAHALARYAALCQEASIVPIVEPEVLMDGEHTIETCHEISEKSFREVFKELDIQGIYLEGMVLKPNMVISGIGCVDQAGVEEVAERTVECLRSTVPDEVPGCAFLSGGQSNENATAHLNKMNEKYRDDLPWNLTFSYGRALQALALQIWRGKDQNINAAKNVFYKRARCNSLATRGKYSYEMEEVVA
jgi:fructose-bisphosphate aldolase class I